MTPITPPEERARLVSTYYPRIVARARHVGRSQRMDPEDLAQECARKLLAHETLRETDIVGLISLTIGRIAINEGLKRARDRTYLTVTHIDEVDEPVDLDTPEPSDPKQRERLAAWMSTLDEVDLEVIRRLVEGAGHRRICLDMGIPRYTMDLKIAKFRKALKARKLNNL